MPKDIRALGAREEIKQRRAKTLTMIVREAIEDMITSGELSAGQRINESAIATQLGISRGPVREACRSLEEAGLLVSEVNQGQFVREMSLDEVHDLYEVRSALAGLAGRLIVQRADDQVLAKLENLVKEMQTAAEKGDVAAYYDLNLDFHDTLVEGSANTALAQTYRWIINQMHLYRRRGLTHQENLSASNREHEAIVSALGARDETKADLAMRQHILGGWERMSALVWPAPDEDDR